MSIVFLSSCAHQDTAEWEDFEGGGEVGVGLRECEGMEWKGCGRAAAGRLGRVRARREGEGEAMEVVAVSFCW